MSNFIEIRHVGAEFYVEGRNDGRTDRYDEDSSRFSQFCQNPSNSTAVSSSADTLFAIILSFTTSNTTD